MLKYQVLYYMFSFANNETFRWLLSNKSQSCWLNMSYTNAWNTFVLHQCLKYIYLSYTNTWNIFVYNTSAWNQFFLSILTSFIWLELIWIIDQQRNSLQIELRCYCMYATLHVSVHRQWLCLTISITVSARKKAPQKEVLPFFNFAPYSTWKCIKGHPVTQVNSK